MIQTRKIQTLLSKKLCFALIIKFNLVGVKVANSSLSTLEVVHWHY